MKKPRWIIQTLILSGALNGALLCLFFYFIIKDHPLHFAYKPKEESLSEPPPVSPAFLVRLATLPFGKLIEFLEDQRELGEGYLVRDYALGILAQVHDFDVERGLGRGGLAKAKWHLEGEEWILFSDLIPSDFETLSRFARLEHWPFTPKGLFKWVRRAGLEKSDPALIAMCCHTPHYILLDTLFARSSARLQQKELLSLILDCDWEIVQRFYLSQQEKRDFSVEARQHFLREASRGGAEPATTPLQNRASQEVVGNPLEKPLRPVLRQYTPAAPDPRQHVIQPGESLWQISRKYQVPLEKLLEANKLQSTLIQPGKTLKIP